LPNKLHFRQLGRESERILNLSLMLAAVPTMLWRRRAVPSAGAGMLPREDLLWQSSKHAASQRLSGISSGVV